MPNADWIRLGVEILSLLGAAFGVYVSLKTEIGRLGVRVSSIESLNREQNSEMKKITELLVRSAVQDQKFVNVDQRMNGIEQRLIELAHGRGLIVDGKGT